MTLRHSRRIVQGFAIHSLANDRVAVSIAPELGGRIVSLKDRVSGREWLDGWAPAGRRRIWSPSNPADYATGPGAGIDECLPTVLPCRHRGKTLPDHGELWNRAPAFDPAAAKAGVFECRWSLRSLPLDFERRISLDGQRVLFEYRIVNRADQPTPFLWAWHPLFSWRQGDEIRFPRAVKSCVSPGGEPLPWPIAVNGADLSRARFPKGTIPAAKVFAGPLSKGAAEIRSKRGARISITWPAEFLPYAGIWITRGFWQGLHHWAIEPTNAPVDRLTDLDHRNPQSAWMLKPRETRTWKLTVTVHPGS
jgi:galactose mutarotase-like enzyme